MLVGAALFAAGVSARAVYAPIPEVEQGRLLTVYMGAGYYYDTNIFGAAEGRIESFVLQAQPTLVMNISAADQTFLSATYQASLDYFDNRPGDKWLASHAISARLAHTFTPRLEAELSDSFQIVKNPESLMPGVGGTEETVNPDQSYDFNQFDGKLVYSASDRVALKGKLRTMHFFYDNRHLSDDLDRGEYIAGLEAVRMSRENLQVSAEYRYKAIRYDSGGAIKDKDSHYLFAGADYAVTKRTAYSTRLGLEALLRRGGPDKVLPFVELGVKHDYRESCFVSGGYTFTAEESSNASTYLDMYAHHLFVNAQHALTRAFALSGSADWRPARLNGRGGVAGNINESNLKLGAALTYAFKDKWSVSLTCDYDYVNSDDPGRDLERTRVGMRGRWVF